MSMQPATTQSGAPGGIFGLAAEFDTAEQLLAAARRVHAAGYKKFDVFSPYPIHGMDEAMGLNRSALGWIIFICGAGGVATALGLQWFANVFDYPLITQGKPFFSWQAFVPVTFELMVLFASFGAVLGMLALNGLPQWYHPTLKPDAMAKVSNNAFFLAIEAGDPQFDLQRTGGFLKEIGGGTMVELES